MSPILDRSNPLSARIAAGVMAIFVVAVLGYAATVLARSTGHPWRVLAVTSVILALRLASRMWKTRHDPSSRA